MRLLGLSGLALLLAAPAALAQGQSISVSHASVDLTVPVGPGGYGTAVNTSAVLNWTGFTPNRTAKVTVGTTAPGQVLTLQITATNVAQGTSTGTVTLLHGAAARDLVRDIPRRAVGQATLRYEAGAPAGPFVGARQDFHTVVFTITQQ